MSNGIALTTAISSSLLSLQKTSDLFATTSNRLSTGLKVSTVFDDPINFIASENLRDDTSDLNRLLDGISTSLRTIESANNAATAVEGLLDSAQSIIDSASEEISSSSRLAGVTGTKDLTGTTDLTSINGISNGDVLKITVPASVSGGDAISATSVSIDTGDNLEELVAEINNLNTASFDTPLISASINSDGGLSIEAATDHTLRIELVSSTATTSAAEAALASSLGLDGIFVEEGVAGSANVTYAATIESDATIDSNELTLASDGTTAKNTTLLTALTGFAEVDDAADTLALSVDVGGSTQKTSADIALFSSTGVGVQDLVNAINNDTTINSLVEASFSEDTGKISVRALDDSVQGVEFIATPDGTADKLDLNFGFGTGIIDTSTTTAADDISEYIKFGDSAGAILSLESQYNDLLTQIDSLVSDSEFRGTNIVAGDTLQTYFSADRSSVLETKGTNLNVSGLGLSTEANFVSQSSVTSFTNERLAATQTVRDFSSKLATDLNVIKTREDYTNSSINTIEGAIGDLTLADQNKESANLLALQTQQALGTSILSIASQSAQSILRLF